MTYGHFRGYSEISNFNLQTRYFHKKVNLRLFKKCCFWGCDVENWVWAKLALWMCPILWIRVKIGYTQLSLTFFHYYRPTLIELKILRSLARKLMASGVQRLASGVWRPTKKSPLGVWRPASDICVWRPTCASGVLSLARVPSNDFNLIWRLASGV